MAQAFAQLQEKRHIADYDNTKSWTSAEALVEVAMAIKAFAIWPMIRDKSVAQDYLVSLLRRRD